MTMPIYPYISGAVSGVGSFPTVYAAYLVDQKISHDPQVDGCGCCLAIIADFASQWAHHCRWISRIMDDEKRQVRE